MRHLLALAFCLVLAAQAWAAGDKPLRIGVLYWSMNIPGQVAMRRGLEAEAEKINAAAGPGRRGVTLLPVVAGDGHEGVERQIAQMNDMVRQRPDAIIVQPTDNAALAEPLRAANRAGIPVVAYDQYISGGKMASYVTSDNYQAGYLDGEYLASLFPGGKSVRLVLIEYPLVSSTVERLNGFLDALRDQGRDYFILKTYQAVEPVSGARAGAQILRDFPEKGSVDAVFAVNDGGGLAVAAALAAAGRDEIAVATIDGDPVAVEHVRARRLIRIDTAQFCGPLGAEAMKSGYAAAQGLPLPRRVLVPVFPITAETLTRYPGWQGPVPASFRKHWPARSPLWEGRPLVTP